MYLPVADVRSDSSKNKISMVRGQVGFVFPVMARRFNLTNDLNYKSFVLLANVRATYDIVDFSLLEKQHSFLSALAGPSFIYNSGNKNTWLLGFAAGAAQDIDILAQTSVRFTGHALFKHKVNGNFSYHIGAVYSYVYGRPLPLPLLGCVIRTGDKSKLKISLPLSTSFYYKTNEFDMLTAFILPDGEQFNIAAGGNFLTGKDPLSLRMRYRSFKCGVNYQMGISKKIFISPELGVSLHRKLTFSDGTVGDKTNFYTGKVNPFPYVKLSIRKLLGDTRWKRTGDNFLLNDERLDYYDLDDPTKL